ncbi:MAG TPA: GGDEF domain-containing protein [Polyangiales bacterium]|nr:GGDEF domain-containing protein [Polyangiales bacterium]
MHTDTEPGPITLITQIDSRLEAQPATRTGTLTVLTGAHIGAVYMLDAIRTVLGRGDAANIALDDDSVSRQHACITRTGNRYELEDLGSTNGTYLAGARVTKRSPLLDGARVRIANCVLRFALQDKLEAEASRRIYEMSVRDALTGVHNRRYFDERLDSEVAFAKRHGSMLCVISCDIDRFKQINDQHGHPAGDMVLQRVSQVLQGALRAEDVFARCGGEEFCVIARGIDVTGARAFAERMRMLLERTVIVWQGKRLAVTVSVGIAHNRSGSFADAKSLTAGADAALYAAKREGRNRTVLAGSTGSYVEVQPATSLAPRPRRRWDHSTAPTGPDVQPAIAALFSRNPPAR